MIDVKQIATAAIDKAIEDGTFEKVIGDTVVKTISEQLEKHFRCWSDFAKQFEKTLEETVGFPVTAANIDSYNLLVAKVVQAKIEQTFGHELEQKVSACLSAVLEEPKAEYKLSELIIAARDDFTDDHNREDARSMTVHVENSTSSYGQDWKYIYIDPKENVSRYSCAIHISVYKDKIHDLKIHDVRLDKQLFVGPKYGFERLLLQLYTRQASIIIDGYDELDLEYPDKREYD